MPAPSEATAIALLAAVLLFLVWKLMQALRRPQAKALADRAGSGVDGAEDDYQALARRDGIDPDVADAFESEIGLRGREMRRRDEERRRQEAGDASAGFDADPF